MLLIPDQLCFVYLARNLLLLGIMSFLYSAQILVNDWLSLGFMPRRGWHLIYRKVSVGHEEILI
jgi:hypothetical protein